MNKEQIRIEGDYWNKNHWYACVMKRDSEVMVEVVQLMIEGNSTGKNLDERVTKSPTCYSVQWLPRNTQQDLMRVEIVARTHDEENQHQVEIMSKWMNFQDQTKWKEEEMKKRRMFDGVFYRFC